MRRCLLIFSVIMFSLMCCTSTQSESFSSSMSSFEKGIMMADSFTQSQNMFFYSASSQVQMLNDNGSSEVVIEAPFSERLLTDGEQLFSLDIENGILTHWKWGEGNYLDRASKYVLPWEKMLEDDEELKVILNIALSSDYLFVLYSYDSLLSSSNLLIFNYKNNSVTEKVDLEARSMCTYKKNEVILYNPDISKGGCEFLIYNPESDELRQYGLFENISALSFVFIPNEDMLYIESSTGVIYAFNSENSLIQVGHFSQKTPSGSERIAFIYRGFYITLGENNLLIAAPIDLSGIRLKTLTFAGYADVDRNINQIFSQKYPEVVIKNIPFSLNTDYLTQIITNSSDVDIYVFRVDSSIYHSLSSKGYAADLSKSEIISSAISRFYPNISNTLMGTSNQIYAIPMDEIFTTQLYAYNTAVLDRIKFNHIPQTVSDLIDFFIQSAQLYDFENSEVYLFSNDSYNIKKYFLNYILQSYISSYIIDNRMPVFDTPLFLNLLAEYEKALPIFDDFGYMWENNISTGDTFDYEESISRTFIANCLGTPMLLNNSSFTDDIYLQYLPLTVSNDEQIVIPVNFMVFLINVHSQNFDLALAYLESYLENFSETMKTLYFPDANTPILRDHYEDEKNYLLLTKKEWENQLQYANDEDVKLLEERIIELELSLSTLEKTKWEYPEESIAQYKKLAPFMYPLPSTGLTFQDSDEISFHIINDYLNGKITKEEFTSKYDQYTNMLFSESQ